MPAAASAATASAATAEARAPARGAPAPSPAVVVAAESTGANSALTARSGITASRRHAAIERSGHHAGSAERTPRGLSSLHSACEAYARMSAAVEIAAVVERRAV